MTMTVAGDERRVMGTTMKQCGSKGEGAVELMKAKGRANVNNFP
jgi:hypothetical protein